jgi:hypothetical protein
MLRVLINQQVIAIWVITANKIQLLQTPNQMMQVETSVHAQKDTFALYQHGNLFHALLELFQIQKNLAQPVNALLVQKEVTVQMQV